MTTVDLSAEAVDVLENAAWASLTGPHARFAEAAPGVGDRPRALRYPVDVSPFMAIESNPGPEAWQQLRDLVGPGQPVFLSGPEGSEATLPRDWEILTGGRGVQLVATDRLVTAPDPEAIRLGPPDVPEMLDLVARTRPGPFLPRTHELGTYLGIRREGKLVALAGERLHPPGFTEISAVCTDPAHRGHGLASRLVRAVAHGIRERGETPMMHASADNENAIRLYLELGFHLRAYRAFYGARTPL